MTSTTINTNFILTIITQAFIDASNLFYGGLKSLGWSIDYKKLLSYLQEKYGVERAYYFGVETHSYKFDYLNKETVPLKELRQYLESWVEGKGDAMSQIELKLIERHLKQIKFYFKLEEFGYTLILKPVKRYQHEKKLSVVKKANCDVDITLYGMIEKNNFERAIIMSGDGDFLPFLKHLRSLNKEVVIIASTKRTAKEIKQFAGGNFKEFSNLKQNTEFERP
jgi:uncharacterized LabA/DUF88 family protein